MNISISVDAYPMHIYPLNNRNTQTVSATIKMQESK